MNILKINKKMMNFLVLKQLIKKFANLKNNQIYLQLNYLIKKILPNLKNILKIKYAVKNKNIIVKIFYQIK